MDTADPITNAETSPNSFTSTSGNRFPQPNFDAVGPVPLNVSGDDEPTWSRDTNTDTQDRTIVWKNLGPKTVVYLVEDISSTYKLYKDCFFVFADPLEAIAKVRTLCGGNADEIRAAFEGGNTLADLTPGALKPGIRHVYRAKKGHAVTEVVIIAVPLIGDILQ